MKGALAVRWRSHSWPVRRLTWVLETAQMSQGTGQPGKRIPKPPHVSDAQEAVGGALGPYHKLVYLRRQCASRIICTRA